MGLFDQISRTVRAKLHPLIYPEADPAIQLEQVMAQMQTDLMQLRQTIAHAIATLKRCERQQVQAEHQAEVWRLQAQVALQQGLETRAREALTHRQSYLEVAKTLTEQLQQQRLVVSQLKQSMMTLDIKLVEAKAQQDMLLARSHTAAATQAVQVVVHQSQNLTPADRLAVHD